MGFNGIAIGLLEKSLTKAKDMSKYLLAILDELRRDNMSVTVEVDTSVTSISTINLNTIMNGNVRSITVLEVGGGLYLQTSLSEPFQVYGGDKIEHEIIETLRWKGAGAGTGVLRITGLRT